MKSDAFQEPIITPATRQEMGDHDEGYLERDIVKGIVSEGITLDAQRLCHKLFLKRKRDCCIKGLILSSRHKIYEFGDCRW
jgi:phosphoribosylaminoimidazole-succinocarboxamide synthase